MQRTAGCLIPVAFMSVVPGNSFYGIVRQSIIRASRVPDSNRNRGTERHGQPSRWQRPTRGGPRTDPRQSARPNRAAVQVAPSPASAPSTRGGRHEPSH
jgi:hypothetical protein